MDGSVVAFDQVVLDSVHDVEPHGGAEELGAPLLEGFDVRLRAWGVADVFGDVVGSHGLVVVDVDWIFFWRSGWLCVCRMLNWATPWSWCTGVFSDACDKD